MHRFLLLLIFVVSFFSSEGQKEEPLIIYKCDPVKNEVMTMSQYPPILKIKKGDLENILNNGLTFPNIENDSTITIYVSVIINCDSTSIYDLPLNGVNKAYPELGLQIIELLKTNCTWSPGKSSIEFTKTILKKENNKIIRLEQYTHHLTKFGIGLKFNIQNRKIKLVNKIKTT